MPDEVVLDGTIRTFDEKWRAEIHKKIEKIAVSLAEGMGGKCELSIDKGYPFLVNDEALAERIRNDAKEYLGKNLLTTLTCV